MQLLIETQIRENYGAHDWDGEGQCPQYWKFKGGESYKFSLGNHGRSREALAELVEYFRPGIEEDNEYYRNHIISWEVVGDDYLTEFEQSQLEYEGKITYPARVLSLEVDSPAV
jgi:hypothetical protein